jgi:ubiquinone/menaquinone biosynthesis C-methylase UbiE
MSSEQARSQANYYGGADFDWDAYHKYRPEYPEKFFDLLFAYHQSTASGSAPGWDQAADFGSGPGTIVPSLLKRFRTVIASDLNETQIQLGRDVLLPKYGAQRIRLHVGKAEECDWLEDGTVDMITAAEAAHWFDDDKWVAQAARKLKSGGTIAFWLYFPSFALINPADPELVDLFTRLNFMRKSAS